MRDLKIRIFPDPVLEKECEEVDDIDDELVDLAQSMIVTMKEAEGLGLSAPQVGVLKRLFVCKDFADADEQRSLVLINPKIIDFEGRVESKEGCLSIPGFYDYIYRHERVSMTALDLDGKQQSFNCNGMQSIVLQHEFDHLDGILFPERMTKIKKEIFLKKINKAFK
tara:strand:+ start:660 stop:1160 length:501 start_codon:yes stop_codon:yes gene_type:complete